MFTIEMDHDEVGITILDQDGNYEDVQFIVYDDIVCIRQWNEEEEEFSMIAMSPDMFDEFRQALDLPSGAYMMKEK